MSLLPFCVYAAMFKPIDNYLFLYLLLVLFVQHLYEKCISYMNFENFFVQ